MKIIIVYFLLVSGSSIIIAVNPPPLTVTDINRIIHEGSSIIIDSSAHTLKLIEDGKLGENDNVIVWAGKYDNEVVAVKIVWDEGTMHDEIAVYQALGALDDNKIEENGVPRVYYHGPVLSNYYAIAMSLFDETLEDRYMNEKEHLSNLNILLIFKRLIEILKYFHSKNVVHNDIKPENIFLRGREVFIGDFDVATLDGAQNYYGTEYFASKNYWADRKRTAMDDLESLLYTMWSVAGVPMGGPSGKYPEGKTLLQCRGRMRVEQAYMKDKHANIKDKDVKHVFKFVSDEVVSGGEKPFYDDMIGELNLAINRVQTKTGETGFEWLRRSSASASTSRSVSAKLSEMKLSRGSSSNRSTRSGSPRLMQNLSTRSGGSVRSRRPSFDRSGSFIPIRSNRFAQSWSYSKLEYQPEDSPDGSPECGCFNILPSCGKH